MRLVGEARDRGGNTSASRTQRIHRGTKPSPLPQPDQWDAHLPLDQCAQPRRRQPDVSGDGRQGSGGERRAGGMDRPRVDGGRASEKGAAFVPGRGKVEGRAERGQQALNGLAFQPLWFGMVPCQPRVEEESDIGRVGSARMVELRRYEQAGRLDRRASGLFDTDGSASREDHLPHRVRVVRDGERPGLGEQGHPGSRYKHAAVVVLFKRLDTDRIDHGDMHAIAAAGLAALLIIAGIGHFTAPDYFRSLVPSWLRHPRPFVAAGGVADIAVGVAILIPATREFGAWSAAALVSAYMVSHLDAVRTMRRGHPHLLWRPWAVAARILVNLAYIAWAVAIATAVS